jgi:RHS repeat-associated protein
VGVTDSSGAGAGGYTYDPFGNPLGTAPNIPWGYAGGYAGPWGGIYHFGYRFYDPTIGRFTQQDPIMTPGDLQQASRYAYVGNSPLDHIDPAGLFGISVNLSALGVRASVSIDDEGPSVAVSGGNPGNFSASITGKKGTYSSGKFVQFGGCIAVCYSKSVSGDESSDSFGVGFGTSANISAGKRWKWNL